MQRVVIVTPTTERAACIASVDAQELPDGWELHHVVVLDDEGESGMEYGHRGTRRYFLALPRNTGDVGATPRGVGAAWAMSLLPDMMLFVDDDNAIDPDHVDTLIELHRVTGRRVVAARRRFVAVDGTPMPHVRDYSDGVSMVDTNCLSLQGAACQLGMRWTLACRYARGTWDGARPNHTGADAEYWRHHVLPVLSHRDAAPIPVAAKPTVTYVTRWARHYDECGMPRPGGAVDVDWSTDPPTRVTL